MVLEILEAVHLTLVTFLATAWTADCNGDEAPKNTPEKTRTESVQEDA